jgi:hypothetical protein
MTGDWATHVEVACIGLCAGTSKQTSQIASKDGLIDAGFSLATSHKLNRMAYNL